MLIGGVVKTTSGQEHVIQITRHLEMEINMKYSHDLYEYLFAVLEIYKIRGNVL